MAKTLIYTIIKSNRFWHKLMNKYQLKNNLKEIRINKGLSQKTLANLIGVSRNTISAIENNLSSPSVGLALLISKVLEKNFEEVFFIINNE